MNRQRALLAGLVSLLVLVAYFFLLLKPRMDEVGEIEDQIAQVEQEQQQLQARIAALEEVRRRAPDIEAQLAAARAVIPDDPAMPAALRQLQLAADESGVRLVSVTTSRPQAVEGQPLATISLSLTIEGGYFQIVDFLRRVEDPVITPRAVLWTSLSVSVAEYPTLSATVTGQLFTRAAPTPEPSPEPSPAEEEPGGEPGAEGGAT